MKGSKLYRGNDKDLGVMSVVRQAPSWFLSLNKTYELAVDGQTWRIVVASNKKTFASASATKATLHIDRASKPQPGFRKCTHPKFVDQIKFARLMAAINERLPAWESELTEQERALVSSAAAYKLVSLERGQAAPLRIVSRPRHLNTLKTKLQSVPDWLFEEGGARFSFNGERWRCLSQPTVRMHVKPSKRRIVINERNVGGYTKNIDASQLSALCEAFNAQSEEARADAPVYKQARADFKNATFRVGASLSAALLEKAELRVRLTEAPQWLIDARQTFYFPFQAEDEIWEFLVNARADEASINAEQRRVVLLPRAKAFKTAVSEPTVTALLAAVVECLPAWRAELAKTQTSDAEKRLAEFQRFGPIKRQMVSRHALIEALNQLE